MKATCSVNDCDSPVRSKGLCNRHYSQWWRQGNSAVRSDRRQCAIEGCGGRVQGRGFCNRHYLKAKRHGDPLAGTTAPTGTDSERFWANVRKTPTCWVWTAGCYADGYGAAKDSRASNGQRRAHRLAYEWLVGPIPLGLVIDHVCHNRRCVNPAHLRAVTRCENNQPHPIVFAVCPHVDDRDSTRVALELIRQCCGKDKS